MQPAPANTPGGAQVMYSHIAEWLCGLRTAGVQGYDEDRSEPAVRFFVMGAERWDAASAWPPPERQDATLRLRHGGGLSRKLRGAGTASFSVDPAASTPLSSRWNLVQHILEEPTDYGDRSQARGLLSFTEAAAREQAFVVAGTPCVALDLELHDGDDAAVFVYLEDVAPSGHVRYVTEGCARAGFHGSDSFCRADLKPFSRGILHVQLQPVAYEFQAGHSVRVSLAGADAQNFLPLEGAAARWTVHLEQSSLVLPELPRGTAPGAGPGAPRDAWKGD